MKVTEWTNANGWNNGQHLFHLAMTWAYTFNAKSNVLEALSLCVVVLNVSIKQKPIDDETQTNQQNLDSEGDTFMNDGYY